MNRKPPCHYVIYAENRTGYHQCNNWLFAQFIAFAIGLKTHCERDPQRVVIVTMRKG